MGVDASTHASQVCTGSGGPVPQDYVLFYIVILLHTQQAYIHVYYVLITTYNEESFKPQ